MKFSIAIIKFLFSGVAPNWTDKDASSKHLWGFQSDRWFWWYSGGSTVSVLIFWRMDILTGETILSKRFLHFLSRGISCQLKKEQTFPFRVDSVSSGGWHTGKQTDYKSCLPCKMTEKNTWCIIYHLNLWKLNLNKSRHSVLSCNIDYLSYGQVQLAKRSVFCGVDGGHASFSYYSDSLWQKAKQLCIFASDDKNWFWMKLIFIFLSLFKPLFQLLMNVLLFSTNLLHTVEDFSCN